MIWSIAVSCWKFGWLVGWFGDFLVVDGLMADMADQG
jgi:hypothetical protein